MSTMDKVSVLGEPSWMVGWRGDHQLTCGPMYPVISDSDGSNTGPEAGWCRGACREGGCG